MAKRFAVLWFPGLEADRLAIRQAALQGQAYVIAAAVHGRMKVQSASQTAIAAGIYPGMVVADARAIYPELLVFPNDPSGTEQLLYALGEWCIRYTPVVAVELPNGLLLDITGCTHLWGGEQNYLAHLLDRMRARGYAVRAAIADTIGAAWAVAHYGTTDTIVDAGRQADVLLPLPPAALRLPEDILQRMARLGFRQIAQLMKIPAAHLRRRFGPFLLTRLQQAMGQEQEFIQPLRETLPYQERLPCLEPIRTAKGIELALERLVQALCKRLQNEGLGLRKGILRCFRVDGKQQQIEIGTNRASHHPGHLFRLFEGKIASIAPGLGIELFELEAPLTESIAEVQESLWQREGDRTALAELLDNIANKLGAGVIHRYLPEERYWPERSVRLATSLIEQPQTAWRVHQPRPLLLLPEPEPIEVMVPLPDYPPVQFRYRGQIHRVRKADGPERIEREWWVEQGQPRDYYFVEDEVGQRYWLFRSGLYTPATPEPKWFVHGLMS